MHTNDFFMRDGAIVTDAQDIVDLVNLFSKTKSKFHFDILDLDSYIEVYDLYTKCIIAKQPNYIIETLKSMLAEYQRYIEKDINDEIVKYAKCNLSGVYGLCIGG